MAGYFSNHSQSRFLAISTNTSGSGNSGNNNGNSSPVTTHANHNAGRPRISSSKYFSTSLLSTDEGASSSKDQSSSSNRGPSNGPGSAVHPLKNTWVFWFRQQRAPGNKTINYEEGIKKISAFGSVESFWALWTHLHPPSELQPTTDYLLFHSGIRRPVWEDPLNREGGKWIVRLKKGVADRLWEDIVLAVVGDQFDVCGSETAGGGSDGASQSEPEICGCTISVRQSEDIVTIWNRDGSDPKVTEKIRETIRRVLNLPPTTVLEYKTNTDSLQDKSSFRIEKIAST